MRFISDEHGNDFTLVGDDVFYPTQEFTNFEIQSLCTIITYYADYVLTRTLGGWPIDDV